MEKRIFIITLGIIIFTASIIGLSITSYAFYDVSTSDYDNLEVKLIWFGLMLLSIIIGSYVKLTNFGIIDDSELSRIIKEKEKLKELIEIAELEQKLKEIK